MKIGKLSDSNFHARKQKVCIVLALRDVDQYIEEDPPRSDEFKTTWNRGERKARAVIGHALSYEHLGHVIDIARSKTFGT